MKVTIFSLWRDSESYIQRALSQVKALEANNKDVQFEYYFYENDSKDNTRAILQDFFIGRKGKLIAEDIGSFKFGSTLEKNRMISMAQYRNKILHAARPMDSDYCIVWDSDVKFSPDILHNFLKYKDEGGMLCPNIRQDIPCVMGSGKEDSFYDSLSLIDVYDIQCMTWADNPFYDEADRAKYEQGLPIEVNACFGGFVVFKTDILNNEKVEWFSDGSLEHWGLCRKVKEYTGEKIIFLPEVKVYVEIDNKLKLEVSSSFKNCAIHQEDFLKMSTWERQLSV